MSDGPHRSLNMSRPWKRLAECADNSAYSLDEVSEAFLPALDQACREEVPDSLWQSLGQIFREEQQMLFVEQRLEQITALRAQTAGLPLGCTLVDLAFLAASRGAVGDDAVVDVVTKALTLRAARGTKQVEEHYYRKSNEIRTEKIRERLESALKNVALNALARQHLHINAAPIRTRVTKHDGLDDGVQF